MRDRLSLGKSAHDFLRWGDKVDTLWSRGFRITQSFNPLPFKRPTVYFTASREDLMVLGSYVAVTLPVNRQLSQLLRHDANGADTNLLATTQLLWNFNPGNNPVPVFLWNNGATTPAQNQFVWGNVNSLNYIHTPSTEFTIYIAVRPLIAETSGTTKIMMGNASTSVDIGFYVGYFNNGTKRFLRFAVFNGTGNGVYQVDFPEYENADVNGMSVYSIRVKDPNGAIGGEAGRSYVNGRVYSIMSLLATQSSANASNVLTLGARPATDLPFRGTIGDIMIFNDMHSPETHAQIVSYLKMRHGIIG